MVYGPGLRAALLASSAIVVAYASPALAQSTARDFDVPAQSAANGIAAFAQQADVQILVMQSDVRNRRTQAVRGNMTTVAALDALLAGTGLNVIANDGRTVTLSANAPQSGSAAGDGAEGTVAALVVTAQKREENIQDVPIAMSAFTQEDLTRSQVATGADLMTQVPNMTFTKTNFTSYSIQIRGIGTQAVSATVDPAVAVAFNSTPLLRAHFFEQEFFDLERVEVLRGPQGTLYGRNATAGVVNLISAKPSLHFAAKVSADVGNYSSTRLEGMLNLPLVEDKAALRIAGAWTKRDGYDTNQLSGRPIDGRDLWATRVTLRIDPTDALRANFVWEHFNEDDDRLRSGKQLCKKAHVPATINGVPTFINGADVLEASRYLDQGCDPTSLYSPEAFQVPDGFTLAYYLPLGVVGAPIANFGTNTDIYASTTQSRDLRVIESQVDPKYRAKSDTVELNFDYDLTPSLTLTSQTAYARDFLWSLEDYNRFNTKPNAWAACDPVTGSGCGGSDYVLQPRPGPRIYMPTVPDPSLAGEPCGSLYSNYCFQPGIFCDPQIGCSDRLILVDLATERARQFSQEIRIASSFDGPFNFSLGANYMRYSTVEKYYVFINTATAAMAGWVGKQGPNQAFVWIPGVSDNSGCMPHGFDYVSPNIPSNPQVSVCGYIDPNPVTSLNDQGHNYFLNQNPYKLQSYALFGEAYYNITPDLKLTAGLRWTVDRKHFDSIPSELLVVGYGYPTVAEIKQAWREPTGRLVLTWTPHLGFTNQTMLYGSYAHGYKAGGENPPGAVLLVNRGGDIPFPTHPASFKPEFVDAYELGTKNTLLDGRLTANLTGFYYDYTGYQISEIVDRSAINLNFDAKIWGAELETDWRPLENLRFGLKLGYENTRVADGQSAVDLMDRTAGHSDWMVVKPFPTQASNCLLPTYVVAALLQQGVTSGGGVPNACTLAYLGADGVLQDPVTRLPYMQDPTVGSTDDSQPPAGYPGFNPETAPNRGAGFSKDLSGHVLPNAPKYTATLTADYTLPLPNDWLITLHGDFYQQSEAWTRIFNDPGYDKLKAYNNVNLAAIFSNEDRGWTVMAYVKNVFDKDNITGAFLNSDDSALTTNVFLNEPRLYGLRVTKNWTDSPWWSAHANKSGWYPFRVELEGYHGDIGNDHEVYKPAYADLYPEDFQFPLGSQNSLAASSGGGVRLTYQPNASNWSLSAGIRYGRAGGGTHLFGAQNVDHPVCYIKGKYCQQHFSEKNGWHTYYETTTQSEEAHTFADFAVGREFGLGSLLGRNLKAEISAGLAYVRFKSTSDSIMHGSPDLYVPHYGFNLDTFAKYYNHFHRFNDHVHADRKFEGAGPELNWNASIPLAGAEDAAGRVDLDLGLGGVVLFGKQRAEVTGQLKGIYGTTPGAIPNAFYGLSTTYDTPLDIAPRSKSVTVPGVHANLGVSYTLGGLKVSGGYRMERYYDAIDGGLMERKTYDRTFDGPYMKVSIGFGG